jgi:hypothetical protein
MSDWEDMRRLATLSRGGRREFKGRRLHNPSDPEATPSDIENMVVEHGARVGDAVAGHISDYSLLQPSITVSSRRAVTAPVSGIAASAVDGQHVSAQSSPSLSN